MYMRMSVFVNRCIRAESKQKNVLIYFQIATTVTYKYPTRRVELSDDKNVVLEWKIKNTIFNKRSKITVEFSLMLSNVVSNEHEYYFALGVANSKAINKMIGPPESYAVVGTFPNSNNENNKNAIYIHGI